MRSYLYPLVGVAALALAAAASGTAAMAGPNPGELQHAAVHRDIHGAKPRAHITCFKQVTGLDGNGVQSTLDYDRISWIDQGAVDFTLTGDCVITDIYAYGYMDGEDHHQGFWAKAWNVRFYWAQKNHPGTPVSEQLDLHGVQDNVGNVAITLVPSIFIGAGDHYWVSVQSIEDSEYYGYLATWWNWATIGKPIGYESVWENPGDAWHTGCISYQPLSQCLPPARDFAIILYGYRP